MSRFYFMYSSKYFIGVTNGEYGIYSQNTKTSQKKIEKQKLSILPLQPYFILSYGVTNLDSSINGIGLVVRLLMRNVLSRSRIKLYE